MKSSTRRGLDQRRRYWHRRRLAWLLAFALPLPLLLFALAAAPGLLLVDLPVGLAAGLLTRQFWPQDYLDLLSVSAARRQWEVSVGDAWPRNRTQASKWLAGHPERRDVWRVRALLLAGRPDEAKQLGDSLPPPATDEERFFRAALDASTALNRDEVVDLESLSAMADAVVDRSARVRAQTQVAAIGLGLAFRGDITQRDALRRVKAIEPGSLLTIQQRLSLLVLNFSGLGLVVAVLAYWLIVNVIG